MGTHLHSQPLFRWQGVAECPPQLKWIESVEDQIPDIHLLLGNQLQKHWDLSLRPDTLSVEFVSEGTWNRVFKVSIRLNQIDRPLSPKCPLAEEWHHTPLDSYSFIFRLSVPILKSIKTRSEVATMRWVKKNTKIPVPRVFMHDATGRTFRGYEWILMEHMPGQPFSSVRERLSDQAKITLGRTVADWVHALWSIPFDGIGSLYDDHVDQDDEATSDAYGGETALNEREPYLGQLCSQQYMGDWRPQYEFDRGPFYNLQSFCLSFADVARKELQDPLQKQRSEIDDLTTYIRRNDHEYVRSNPEIARWRQALAERSLNEETPKMRVERQVEVEQCKNKLAKHLAMHFKDGEDMANSLSFSLHTGVSKPCDLPAALEYDSKGLVSLQEPRYGSQSFNRRESSLNRLTCLIEKEVPKGRLPPRSCVLHHWDISGNNVLVDPDDDGRVTALLDWEQLYTIPVMPLIKSANSIQSAGPGTADGVEPGQFSWPSMSATDVIPLPPLLSARMSMPDYSGPPSRSRLPKWEDPSFEEEMWELSIMRFAYKERLKDLFSSSTTPPDPDLKQESILETILDIVPDMIGPPCVGALLRRAEAAERAGVSN